MKVAIFDYGAGNIFSLKNSLEKNGAEVDVITGFDNLQKYSGLLLPGVGNFDPAIRSIRDYSAIDFNEYLISGNKMISAPPAIPALSAIWPASLPITSSIIDLL